MTQNLILRMELEPKDNCYGWDEWRDGWLREGWVAKKRDGWLRRGMGG